MRQVKAKTVTTAAPDATVDRLARPLRDLRISVTDRCNFRCPYCMPAEHFGGGYRFSSRDELLSFEETTRLATILAGLGVHKIRLTGGEPLLRRNLQHLVSMLHSIDGVSDLALTTNGLLLADQADELSAAGLDRVTVSLDSLDEDAFKELNGRDYGPEPVLKSIDAADKAGLRPIKINCVVVRGVNDHTVPDLVRAFRGSGHVVRFIEYMDVGTLNRWNHEHVVTASEILELIDSEFPLEPAEANYRGEVASRYLLKDGSGEVGIIASVSTPFCGDCTRARLSSDGKLVTCLFAAEGVDLKTPMREGASDEELLALITRVWRQRSDRYSELRAANRALADADGDRKIEMYQIGG